MHLDTPSARSRLRNAVSSASAERRHALFPRCVAQRHGASSSPARLIESAIVCMTAEPLYLPSPLRALCLIYPIDVSCLAWMSRSRGRGRTNGNLAADSRRTVDGLQRALGGCDIVRPFLAPAFPGVFQRTNHAEDPSTREPGTCYSENAPRAFSPPGNRSALRSRQVRSWRGEGGRATLFAIGRDSRSELVDSSSRRREFYPIMLSFVVSFESAYPCDLDEAARR